MMFSKHNNKGSVNPNAQICGDGQFTNSGRAYIAHAAEAASYAQAANVPRFSGDEDTVDGPTSATELHHKTARRTASRE